MSTQPPTPTPGMFAEPKRDGGLSGTSIAIAVVAIVILAAVLVMLGRRPAAPVSNTLQAPAAYGDKLEVSDVQMSESMSLSGGKSTYIDGRIGNKGDKTVTGVTLQVVFANDTGMPPQIETVPQNLIRTREPYVDTEPVSAAPIPPGGEADFRLIFEDINANWNQQTPGMRAVQVSTR